MQTCNTVGCPCKGTNDYRSLGFSNSPHYPMKAYEGGYIYYAASYGYSYNDPIATFVSLVPGKAERAAEKAAEEEWESCQENDEELDIVVYGECGTYPAGDLFTARELLEHRHALLRGETVCLDR